MMATNDETQSTKEMEEEEYPKPKFGTYSWFILAIIVAIRVCFQWQRSIFSYSYGYTGVGV